MKISEIEMKNSEIETENFQTGHQISEIGLEISKIGLENSESELEKLYRKFGCSIIALVNRFLGHDSLFHCLESVMRRIFSSS